MHEVIVDYEYRPVVAGINRLIDTKWTGGGGGFARAEEEWNRRSVGAITTKWATSGYQRCRN